MARWSQPILGTVPTSSDVETILYVETKVDVETKLGVETILDVETKLVWPKDAVGVKEASPMLTSASCSPVPCVGSTKM